jgi:cell division protein ZapE
MTLAIDEQTDALIIAGPLARYRFGVENGRIKPDSLQEQVATKLEALHDSLAGYQPSPDPLSWRSLLRLDRKRPNPRGLYIHGSVGRGKSMLMDLFFAGAPVDHKRRVHFHAFMAEIHQRLHHFRQVTKGKSADPLVQVAAEVASQTWLLCFDEFVVNDIADAMILGRLFQTLFDQGVIVVATSNFAPKDLYKDGLQRDRFEPFIAEIESRLDVVALDGPRDYRLARLAGRPVYYAPLGPAAAQALDQAWNDLTGDMPGEPDAVTVAGRSVPVPRAAGDVARFSFADLCERPLGASDYLALAKRYRTLLIDDVPLLVPARHNEARRFITLIDALYEAKARLFLSAAAEPDQLYAAGRGAFEFTRTASRLAEMQSASYLAGVAERAAE